MARTVTIPATGSVVTDNATPSFPSTAVGAAPQWADDSDATYAFLQGVYQTGVGIPGKGTADLETGISMSQSSRSLVTARVRISHPQGKPLPSILLERLNGDTVMAGGETGVAPMGPVWVDIPLAEAEPGGLGRFLYGTDSGTESFRLTIACPTSGFDYPSGATGYDWTIYEAALVVTAPSTDAPPCRIFPRRDGLGVGAGVAFPPPRSQQRSPGNRGVGYY